MRVRIAAVVLSGVLCCGPACAQNDGLEGAWATDAGACAKIFVWKKGKVSVASKSDAYGSGLIIEGDRVRGKLADCRIERRKRDGNLMTFVAVCSTDIALSTLQFSLRIDDDSHITRFFPGMEGMEVAYSRCSFPDQSN